MSAGDVGASGTSIWLDDLSRAKISGVDPHSLPSRIANDFELIIQDDGAGINEAALRLRASKILDANVDSLTLADLVFADGLSSRDKATELSGRGVGMAAVRAEVLRLGGTVAVETVPEQGTRFVFRIPILKDIAV